jgi:glycosyltransferase involved in cell wall biosynthesis
MIDILMITYNRPDYTRLSLTRLLETCDETMRVWLWHNGDHAETLEIVKTLADHPRVHEFHHSKENKKLREPTNWLWQNSHGRLLGKVDDDCLVPPGWVETLRRAHCVASDVGIVSCWHFREEDFVPETANKKIRTLAGGHRLMLNCWTGGSGYLMKRECISAAGIMRPNESFTGYCIRLGLSGWTNGWYFPFLYQDHMDDPRSPNTLLKTDEDLTRYLPLSARANGVKTLAEWEAQLKRSALLVQNCSADPKHYVGWRANVLAMARLARRLCGSRRQW